LDQFTAIRVMLYLGAIVSVAAAGFALLLIPVSRMRVSWLLVCLALGLQALRRIIAVADHATLWEAISGLAVSSLLLAGLVGIRHVFLMLRRTKQLLDTELGTGAVIENRAGAAIVILDPDGRILEINESTRVLLKAGKRSLVGVDWFSTFVPEERREETRASWERLAVSGGGNDEYVEYVLTDLEGQEHSVVWHRRLLRDAEGRTIGVRSAGVDLTDSTLLEKELAFRSLLLDHTNDSVIVYRFDGTVVYANDIACTYRGLRREDIVGTDIRRLVLPRDRDAFAIHLETVERGSCVTFETETVDRGGVVRPLEAHVCPVSLGGERLVVDVARDITERREAESAIRRLAYMDHLTGLPNRVLLYDRANQALARVCRSGEHQALLFLDLDNLKRVNDTSGHAAGDELLRQVGERLASTFRGEDTVARIGGDEFVVFVRVADAAEAEIVAGRVISLLNQPFVVGGDEIYSSVSVGMAIAPDHGTDLDGLIAKADAAMYVAKEQGRDRYRLHGEERGAAVRSGG
jgi:diguanylate cyclase (GGDEF)-like protein/PAS domain S-box-containing protein